MSWPTLERSRVDELTAQIDEARTILQNVAGIITNYPGGGSPAHQLREASSLATEARTTIEEL